MGVEKTSVKIRNPKSIFTVEAWREKFEAKKMDFSSKNWSVFDALVEVDKSYNVVKGGRFNDYKNVLAGNASLIATQHVVETLEKYERRMNGTKSVVEKAIKRANLIPV